MRISRRFTKVVKIKSPRKSHSWLLGSHERSIIYRWIFSHESLPELNLPASGKHIAEHVEGLKNMLSVAWGYWEHGVSLKAVKLKIMLNKSVYLLGNIRRVTSHINVP